MSLKNVAATYSKNRGTILPGYNQETNILGQNPGFDAPGFGFISGLQEDEFAFKAASEKWLVNNDSTGLIYNYANTNSENYNIRATIRPIKTLRIQLTATRNYSNNMAQQFFAINDAFVDSSGSGSGIIDVDNDGLNDYYLVDPINTGNFSMSFLTFNTAFLGDDPVDRSSKVFANFLKERKAISSRLGKENDNSNTITSTGFNDGYGETSQDVLIPAFIAAYSGKSGEKVSLKNFKNFIPLPNWRVTYDGLSKIALVNRVFKKFTLTHGYKSTLNYGSFTTNLLHEKDVLGDDFSRDLTNNFVPELSIASVSINEQFSPLLGVDMTLNNNMLLRVEFKKNRNASLSMSNNQITEIKGNEWSVGTGYKFRKVRLPIAKAAADIDTRIDVGVRDNNTVVRRIVENVTQLTTGSRILTVKLTADYRVSSSLNLRAFYDFISTKPFVSNTFPTTNTNVGISIRFTFAQ